MQAITWSQVSNEKSVSFDPHPRVCVCGVCEHAQAMIQWSFAEGFHVRASILTMSTRTAHILSMGTTWLKDGIFQEKCRGLCRQSNPRSACQLFWPVRTSIQYTVANCVLTSFFACAIKPIIWLQIENKCMRTRIVLTAWVLNTPFSCHADSLLVRLEHDKMKPTTLQVKKNIHNNLRISV